MLKPAITDRIAAGPIVRLYVPDLLMPHCLARASA